MLVAIRFLNIWTSLSGNLNNKRYLKMFIKSSTCFAICNCVQRMPCSCKGVRESVIVLLFCKDCMKFERVCIEHENLYTNWLCDALQCEPCLRRSDKCVCFSVLLSILDQVSCYEKYGRSVSSSM